MPAMNRIDAIFQTLRQQHGSALMPFITVGDPDLATTEALLPVLADAGASVIELGIPFSDPIADGPVIQASMTHALRGGVKLRDIFQMVQRVRPKVECGLVAMVSYSIVYRIGINRFIEQAGAAGIDGFIFPDLPMEEAEQVQAAVSAAGLIMSMLIAPTTPIERAKRIAAGSSGFVYVVSRSGITGEANELPPELPGRLRALRSVTNLPMAVGFGISNAKQVREVVSVADAAIVGSAIMRRIAEHRDEDRGNLVKHVANFTRELAEGLSRE